MGAFGAGISLAIASSILLLIVSSVVAFNGWPDDLNGASEPEVARLSQARQAASAAATRPVALPRPVASASSGDAVRAAHRRGRTSRGSDDAAANVPGTDTAGQVAPASSTEPASPSPSSSSGDPVAKVVPTTQVGDAVRDTTGAVADTVAPVAPSVGGALQSVGAAGADAVDQVGQTVDDVVGKVLP
ncbi:MAG: hypothetical protein ACJ762_09310 [Solirubrobacteraceae bacterium]